VKVFFPQRVIDRHVGGNTTYARQLERGLNGAGVATGRIPATAHSVGTALLETWYGVTSRHRSGDVLHYSADTGPLVSPRTPSVVTVHGVASRWISTARTSRQEAIWRRRVRGAIRSCDEVITVSHSSARDVAEVFGVPHERIRVIHHGIDRTPPVEEAMSSDVRNQLPEEYLLYVGNIEPRKNLVALVGAMARPEVKALGLPLVVAGRPAWNVEDSMAAIRGSASTIYLGFVSDDDRQHLMRECTAFVFPSLYEGFGFPVLEAMAAGAPVITSDRGSLAEVAGPAYRLGELSPEGIASGIAAALGSPEELATSVEKGRSWVEQFTWDKSVAAHLEVYRSVTGALS